jgi:hypothetical protein
VKGFLLFVLLSLISGTVALAEGVDGFELGMPMAKVRQLAIEKSYTFSNPTGSSNGGRWVSYVLFGNSFAGPTLSFCDITLSAVSLQRPSSLHEIVSTVKDWKSAYGEPQVLPTIMYPKGKQYSNIEFQWLGEDNIRRDIAISQYGQAQTDITFGYSYIKHPCNR